MTYLVTIFSECQMTFIAGISVQWRLKQQLAVAMMTVLPQKRLLVK